MNRSRGLWRKPLTDLAPLEKGMAVGGPQGGHDSQFRIETHEGFPEPRTRVLKHDETFAVLNDFGNMVADRGCTHGLYHRDTRYLSRLELRLNGDHPLLLSSFSAEDGLMHPVDLTNSRYARRRWYAVASRADLPQSPPICMAIRVS